MRVRTLAEIPSVKGIIPAGKIIDIPPAVMLKLGDKVEVIPLSSPTLRAWMTEDGELRTSCHIPDLETEIVNLTMDNLPLQRQLLELHCEGFDRHHISDRWEQWEERAAIMQHDGGMTKEEAEIGAARQMNLMAFMADRGI